MSVTELDPAQIRTMLQLVTARIIAAEPAHCEADRQLGDGDHGLGMKRGMLAAQKELSENDGARQNARREVDRPPRRWRLFRGNHFSNHS